MWLLRVVGYHWRPGDHVSSADYTRKIGSPYHPLKCDLGIDRHKSFTQRQIHVIISICWRNSLSATGMQELEIVSTKMESLVLKKKYLCMEYDTRFLYWQKCFTDLAMQLVRWRDIFNQFKWVLMYSVVSLLFLM